MCVTLETLTFQLLLYTMVNSFYNLVHIESSFLPTNSAITIALVIHMRLYTKSHIKTLSHDFCLLIIPTNNLRQPGAVRLTGRLRKTIMQVIVDNLILIFS